MNKNINKMSDSEIDKNVSIIGTKFDRRKKLSDRTIKKIKKLYDKGFSLTFIANKLNVSIQSVRYHGDPFFKQAFNASRKSYNKVNKSAQYFEDRVAYKRKLLLTRQVKL